MLGIVIPAARVFCFCWQVFIPAGDLFLLAVLHYCCFDILPKSLSCSLTCKSILPPWKQARKIYYWDLTSAIRACGELLKRRIYRTDLKPFLTNSKEKLNLISLSKMSDHEDETITKENAHPKVVPQITTFTNISTKFPYLKKGEYDIWAMKMQNFISSSDLLCWNIVLKGNSAKSMTTDNDGNLKIRPPVTAEEHQQVQREEKAPDEHMGDFYNMIDARDIWNAIKARFGGNAESKKMQKSLLKQKFEEFKISEEEGLDKGYDKMQKILTQMNTLKIKPEPEDVNMKFLRGLPPSWSGIALILKTKGGLEYISFDDLYNKLKFLEIDTKGQGNLSYQESGNGGYTTTLYVSPGSSSSKGSSKSKCSVVDDVIYSFFANHEIDQHLVYEDLDQMNKEEFKEYYLKHQMAMLSIKVHRFEKKDRRKIKFNGRENARYDKKLVKCFNCKQISYFSRECQAQGGQNSNNYQKYKSKEVGKDGSDSKAMVVVDGSIDWDKQTEEGNTEPRSLENFGMIAGIKIESDADSDGEVVSANDVSPACVSVFAGNVAAAVVSPQSETEFALMGLSTEAHKNAVKILEKHIKCHQKNQLAYEEKIRVLSYTLEDKSNIIEYRQKLIDQAAQEKQELMTKLDNEIANQAKWNNSGKNLYKLIDSSMSVRTKRGLGLDKYIGEGELGIDDSKVSIFHTNSDELKGQPIYNSVECSRPNHSDHDSIDSIFSVSAPTSESRDTIVIDCDRQEDFTSVCSIETDEKSSKTLCNKFGSFNKESRFRKHISVASKSCYVCGSYLHLIKDCDLHEQGFTKRNAEGKGILGRRPTGKPVNPNRPKPSFCCQPNPVSAGQPNPVSAGEATLACNSISLSVSAGDGILGPRPLNIQPKNTYFHSFTHNNQQIIFPITHNSLYSLYMTGRLNGKTAVKPSAGWPWTKYGMSKTKGSKINGGSKSKSWSYVKGPLGRPKMEKAKDRGIVDSGCSRNFPLLDPSMVILSIPRKHNLYTFSLNELAPKGPLTCLIAKAYRVYNLVSRKIEETMNLKFLKNKPFAVGTGQAWMFDIDYLTNSLNYSRVSSTNLTAGSQGKTL
nr:ribonuclease H-like domain-containing protein [Tanacetum cinerariifolium]